MTRLPLLAVLVAGLAAPVAARDATWLIAPSALVEVARGLGGPAARVETREEEEAVTAYCQGLGVQTADALLLTRRLLDPAEVAETIVWLVTGNTLTTGARIAVDGGI